MRWRRLMLSSLSVIWLISQAFAGTTGKIAGTVVDAATGEPLPGANIILDGTNMGAASNAQGYYVILNVPPGAYTLHARMIGYADFTVQNVRVNIDLTTTIDVKLRAVVLQGEEVTIVAERPVVVKDVSASQLNINAEQVENLPVASVTEVIGLQAGILTSTSGPIIRGGGPDQIAFMLDGFTLRDERTNLPFIGVSLSSIQDIQVQTGGFNAEYGNIRSGLVNVVTKEGDRQRYSGTINVKASPAAPKHFGPSGYDRDSYWVRPWLDDAVAWTGTTNGAWDQSTQDQYPSFIGGWYAETIRRLQDNDPTNDLTPYAAQRVFEWQHRKKGDIQEPDYNIDLGFGGPLPLLGKPFGNMRFFFSYRAEQNEYLIPLSRDGYNDNVSQLKLTTNIKPNMKLTLSALYSEIHGVNNNNIGLPGYFYSTESVASVLSSRSFISSIMFATDYFAPTAIYRNNVSAKLTHTLSSSTFYELSIERMANLYKTAPRALRDTTKVQFFGDGFGVDEAPFGYMPFPSSGIDGLRMGVGMSNSRDTSKVFTTTAKFNITSQMNPTNQVKAGLEFIYNQQNVKYGGVDLTLPAGRPTARWKTNPLRASAYLQDKLEFKGLIANLGVRLDYSDPNTQWIDVGVFDRAYFSSSYTPDQASLIPMKQTRRQLFLSPRLGISHPITENSKLYFNYGHFRSMPDAESLYNVQRVTEGRVSQIGDPNNTLQKTVAYELGYDHNLFNAFLLHIAAYYKDVTNEPNSVRFISFDSKVNYTKTEANLYEDIRGFEISLDKRLGRWVNGFVNYTYQVSTSGYFGKLRRLENPADQRQYDRLSAESKGAFNKPIPRPFFRTQVEIKTPSDFGPLLLGKHLLGDLRASFLTTWRAGFYATWTAGLDPIETGIRNNIQYPNFFNIELRLAKDLRLGRYNLRLYMDVNNLLNYKMFTPYAFSDGNDVRDYYNSLLWPREIGEPLGYTVFGNDHVGSLRPENVKFDPLEPNPQNDPEIAARNNVRIKNKSYIDNPNLKWLYYLNPRDIFFGVKIDF